MEFTVGFETARPRHRPSLDTHWEERRRVLDFDWSLPWWLSLVDEGGKTDTEAIGGHWLAHRFSESTGKE